MDTGSSRQLVIDASVAIKWLVHEDDSWMAVQLRDAGQALYAPYLLASEIANILWKKVRRGEVNRKFAMRSSYLAMNFPFRWANDVELLVEAVEISLAIDHPAYDCMYIALANRIRGTLITADTRLARAVESTKYENLVVPLHKFEPRGTSSLVHQRTP